MTLMSSVKSKVQHLTSTLFSVWNNSDADFQFGMSEKHMRDGHSQKLENPLDWATMMPPPGLQIYSWSSATMAFDFPTPKLIVSCPHANWYQKRFIFKISCFLVTDEQMDKNGHVENIMPPPATQA